MLRSLINTIQKYKMNRAAYWQLNSFSDRELKDMGISRCDIYRVTYLGQSR